MTQQHRAIITGQNGARNVRSTHTKTDPSQTMVYQIRIEGHLDFQWSDCFGGLTITLDNGDTLLTGPVIDQAALFGLLKKIRDLGMPLVSLNRVESCLEHSRGAEKSDVEKGEMK